MKFFLQTFYFNGVGTGAHLLYKLPDAIRAGGIVIDRRAHWRLVCLGHSLFL
jgi:hypothetical protein